MGHRTRTEIKKVEVREFFCDNCETVLASIEAGHHVCQICGKYFCDKCVKEKLLESGLPIFMPDDYPSLPSHVCAGCKGLFKPQIDEAVQILKDMAEAKARLHDIRKGIPEGRY